MKRRNFLIANSLAIPAIGLSDIVLSKEQVKKKEKSVIMIFLGGGISHAESFTAAPDSVDKYRSVNGYVKTKSGFYLGGLWEKLAKSSDLYSVVHSFSHINPGHQGGTHYVMTGYNLNDENQGASQNHPGYGSILSKSYGTNDEQTSMPTYVSLSSTFGEKADFLGAINNPMTLAGEGKNNLTLGIPEERFLARKYFLEQLDKRFNARVNKDVELYKKQGFNMILGPVKEAFAIEKEPEHIKNKYGNTEFGRQAMQARRLIEHGSRFVTLHHGGWDMHENIKVAMEARVPETDHVIFSLLNDLNDRGMLEDTLVVIGTEFGRTPLNVGAGRDHWSRNTPLLLAGGNYIGGKVIGEVDKNGFEVKSSVSTPLNLLSTILDHVGINPKTQFTDLNGRPRYLVEGNSLVIK